MVAVHIQHRRPAEGGQKREVLRRHIPAGENQVHIAQLVRAEMVPQIFGFFICNSQYLHCAPPFGHARPSVSYQHRRFLGGVHPLQAHHGLRLVNQLVIGRNAPHNVAAQPIHGNDGLRRQGAARLLHICGGNSAVYRDFKNLGADLIEIDSKVDLSYARQALGEGNTAMVGNLAPVATIMQGTPELVREKAQEAIDKSGRLGFILGSGCEVPIQTPRENIKAMIETARSNRF